MPAHRYVGKTTSRQSNCCTSARRTVAKHAHTIYAKAQSDS
jgi:hypothetical protein